MAAEQIRIPSAIRDTLLPGGSPSLQILARKPGSIVAKAFRHPVDQIPRTVRGAREPVAPSAHFRASRSDSRPFNHRDTVHKADRNPQCTKINQAPSRSITNPQSEGQPGRVQTRQPEQSPLSRSRRTTRVTGLLALRSKQTLGGCLRHPCHVGRAISRPRHLMASHL